MGKRACIGLIVLFLLLITVPNVMFLFPSTENLEQRTLAEMPALSLDTVESFPASFDTYYSDHLPAKNLLVETYSRLCWNVFGVSSNPAVIRGDAGWLFFDSKKMGYMDELADYQHSAQYTQEELEAIAAVLTGMDRLYASKGAAFYFMVCPNKTTIYGDTYMPGYLQVKVNEFSRTQQLLAYLREHTSVKVVDPTAQMQAMMAQGKTVYQKTDTHWNQLGSFAGYQALCGARNVAVPELPAYTPREVKGCDLSRMLAITDWPEEWYSVAFHPDVTVTEVKRDDGYTETTSNAAKEDKWLVYHDSFMLLLRQYLAADSARCVFKSYPNGFNVTAEDLDNVKPTAVLLQMVERNVPLLAEWSCAPSGA